MDKLIELAGQLEAAAIAWFPRLAAALGLFLAGWLLALLLRYLTRRILQGLTRIIPRKSGGFEASAVELSIRAERIFPSVIFWFLIFIFSAAAVETLGLPILTTWLGEVATYVPNILVALLIVFGGFWAGGVVGALTARALSSSGHGGVAGRITQVTIVSVSIVVGIAQLGVDLSFLTAIITIVAAGFLLAGALAFGLGARTVVSNILAAHYVQKIYEIGQEVAVEDISGTVVEMGDTFILLETTKGRVAIPAKLFVEKASTQLKEVSVKEGGES